VFGKNFINSRTDPFLTPEEPEQPEERSPISEYLSQIGRKGGLKGGPARAKKLSSKRRKEIAEEAVKMRWAAKENK
jgi:hypothetical protein